MYMYFIHYGLPLGSGGGGENRRENGIGRQESKIKKNKKLNKINKKKINEKKIGVGGSENVEI